MSKQIPLTKGFIAVVDDCDYERASQYHWLAMVRDNTVYASRHFCTNGKYKRVYLHRFVLGVTNPKIKIDHRDRNGLNCQRYNLRAATKSQNGANAKVFKNNTSGYKGVQWHPRSNKWMARICVNYKNIYLGLHVKPMDAAKAYNDAAKIFFGEFANGNAIG